ncbi:hypothetical protein BofuT4_P115750.1 [Botrytis cinerea T4]|uniref:Uncharacterized protein n=1 Tax=Botryotinia fuckeliana (strain T4) TaxID=999810 RepID=G2Y2H9_BOTF4|nr:hypothetical protein BofuT4_P115750.1 [Botrytis cinerea T4]
MMLASCTLAAAQNFPSTTKFEFSIECSLFLSLLLQLLAQRIAFEAHKQKYLHRCFTLLLCFGRKSPDTLLSKS